MMLSLRYEVDAMSCDCIYSWPRATLNLVVDLTVFQVCSSCQFAALLDFVSARTDSILGYLKRSHFTICSLSDRFFSLTLSRLGRSLQLCT